MISTAWADLTTPMASVPKDCEEVGLLQNAKTASDCKMLGRRGGCPNLSAFFMSSNMFITEFFRVQRSVFFKNVRFAVVASQFLWCASFFIDASIMDWWQMCQIVHQDHQVNFRFSKIIKNTCWEQPLKGIAPLFRSQLRPKLYLYYTYTLLGWILSLTKAT